MATFAYFKGVLAPLPRTESPVRGTSMVSLGSDPQLAKVYKDGTAFWRKVMLAEIRAVE